MKKNKQIETDLLEAVRKKSFRFIESCEKNDKSYSLTLNSDSSPYALCFAIFGYHLLLKKNVIENNRLCWDKQLRHNLTLKRSERLGLVDIKRDKSYLQLLAFTLSALSILKTLEMNPLEREVCEVIPNNIEQALIRSKCLDGAAQSGNYAMFIAIFLIHAKDYLGLNVNSDIKHWSRLHLKSMNKFGYWGNAKTMSYLQFQNGYHQYEILDYLEIPNPRLKFAMNAVSKLADNKGHFAPYLGGGGCFDYDAIYILTSDSMSSNIYNNLLKISCNNIISEQNSDGGFCESLMVRPRSLRNILFTIEEIINSKGQARVEKIRYGLTLMRSKNNKIHTHWSKHSRNWGESDLWDTWFRMLTIARIDVALDPSKISEWGFINYPGIGFHNLLSRNFPT
jgi:hypothetical protein